MRSVFQISELLHRLSCVLRSTLMVGLWFCCFYNDSR